MRTRTALAATVAVTAISLTACGTTSSGGSSSSSSGNGGTTSTKNIKIAEVAGNAQDPYWVTLMCGSQKEAKSLGVSLDWKAGNTTSTQEQETNYESAMLSKPNGVIVASFEPGTFATQVKSLMSKGIPVVSANGPTTPATEYQLIESNTDNSTFAQLVASQAGKSGDVAFLAGATVPAIQQRWQPIAAAIKKADPGLTILPTQIDNYITNTAASIASALISAHPNLKAIYDTSGPEGQGVAEAVQQAHKQGQIKVYSYDATPVEVTDLKNGSITALLAQSPSQQGALSVKALVDYLKAHPKGGAVKAASPAQVLVPLKILTKSNINSAAAQDYQYKATCSS